MILVRTLIAGAMMLAAGTADAANWTIDKAKSSIGFAGTQTGKTFTGSFSDYTATISFDPAQPQTGHALIIIKTGSAKTGDTRRDEAMPGADWFNTALFPTAIFEAKTFKAAGPGRFEADGTLTIRNIVKPVALPFVFTPNGSAAAVTGKIELLRTDYGVGQGSWDNGDWVGLNVTVTIKLSAAKV